jgi:GT2 family glycosyltransferase
VSVSVVVVGFGDEPVLQVCISSVREQLGEADELVLVDHGITDLPDLDDVTVITPPTNAGFGGGCNAGAAAAKGEVLVFLNSDAELRPGALAALSERVRDPSVGLTGGLVLLPGGDDIVNSTGLPVHLSGLSWCDGYGERLSARHLASRRLTSVAGALFACRREVWEALGGMDTSYFMYHEDTDLSLRCHLSGLDVVYCPEAVAVHTYEFSRNPDKMFHLERNRFLTVFGDYPRHLLARVLPVLAVLEPLYLAVALRDGWGAEKVRAWVWLARHWRAVAARRSRVQAEVVRPHALDDLLSPAVTQTQLERPGAMSLLNAVLRSYWWVARPRAGRPERVSRRPDVVVLRTNPHDSSLARLLEILVERYRVLAVVWDRTGDYRCPVESPHLSVQSSRRAGEYLHWRTIVSVAGLQPWFLWRTLRARPRLVHAMDLDTAIVGLVAARLLRVPLAYQCLDPYAASMPTGWPSVMARFARRLENAVIGAADLFVITDRGRLPQHEGADPRALAELPNIPLREIQPRPMSDNGLVVGYVGSLVPHRALEVLVDTVGSLADERVQLRLGGFGVLEDRLRRKAARHPNVEFLGPLDYDVALDVLGDCDVLVQLGDPTHPALRWVSPNKVFESMAMGRPLIVAEGTLAADRAVKAGHGVPVRYGDADDLGRALLSLRDDRPRAEELGAAGRRAFDRYWSPDRVSTAVLHAYEGLIGSGGRP